MSSTEQPTPTPLSGPVVRPGLLGRAVSVAVAAAAAVAATMTLGVGGQGSSVALTLVNHSASPMSSGLLDVPPPLAPERAAEVQVKVGSIPLTLAPGWHIGENDDEKKFLFAVNGSDNVAFSLQEGSFKPGTTVEEVLNSFSQKALQKMTNRQTSEPYDPKFTGARFQASQALEFSGYQQTTRGTAQVVGVIAVLLNPKTGQAGLVKIWAHNSETLSASMEDAIAMTSSTLD